MNKDDVKMFAEKWKKKKIEIDTNNEKNQNARRKGKLQVLANIGSRRHQTNGHQRKKKKYLRRTRKHLKTKFSGNNFIKGNNTWTAPAL